MEEQQYIDLVKKILEQPLGENRTGIKTKSIFGNMMRFTLFRATEGEEGEQRILPLITVREIHYKSVLEELLWFISGKTDSKILHDKGVRIWDGNSDEKTIKKLNLPYREGDCGPIYSFQWRHCGSEYIDCDSNYEGQGIDQLYNCIKTVKEDPYSRRNILCSWNPKDISKMVLPPCHVMCQFKVNKYTLSSPFSLVKQEGEKQEEEIQEEYVERLDCFVTQRSADVPLGVPFNIASYATLTHMISFITGYKPGTLVYNTVDTHIYENQIKGCMQLIGRKPYKFPTLKISAPLRECLCNEGRAEYNIDDFTADNFELENYNHHKKIIFPLTI